MGTVSVPHNKKMGARQSSSLLASRHNKQELNPEIHCWGPPCCKRVIAGLKACPKSYYGMHCTTFTIGHPRIVFREELGEKVCSHAHFSAQGVAQTVACPAAAEQLTQPSQLQLQISKHNHPYQCSSMFGFGLTFYRLPSISIMVYPDDYSHQGLVGIQSHHNMMAVRTGQSLAPYCDQSEHCSKSDFRCQPAAAAVFLHKCSARSQNGHNSPLP